MMQVDTTGKSYNEPELMGRNALKATLEQEGVVVVQGTEENLHKLQDDLRKADYKKIK